MKTNTGVKRDRKSCWFEGSLKCLTQSTLTADGSLQRFLGDRMWEGFKMDILLQIKARSQDR